MRNRRRHRLGGIGTSRSKAESGAAGSALLIEGDTVRTAWELGRELPDVDAVLAAAWSLSR
jgi:hypothetical protein